MLIVDAFAFCRNGEQQEGDVALASLPRLQNECIRAEVARSGNDHDDATGHALAAKEGMANAAVADASAAAVPATLHWTLTGLPAAAYAGGAGGLGGAGGQGGSSSIAVSGLGRVDAGVSAGGSAVNYPRLQVTVAGHVQLQCQRCLTPYSFYIESSSTVIFARDEDAADKIDAALAVSEPVVADDEPDSLDEWADLDFSQDDDSDAMSLVGAYQDVDLDDDEFSDELLHGSVIEVVVGSKSFDMMELIEDEALLAIPLAPKHEVCPSEELLDAFATAKKESPFAALKNHFRHD